MALLDIIMLLREEREKNLFPTVTPTVIENVDITMPPEIDKLMEAFKSDTLKDLQHEIQSPGTPNHKKVGVKISQLAHKTRQELKKKGVLQVTGRKLYVVGGVVRDWLVNHFHGIAHSPDDWDLATDASPESLQLIIRAAVEEKKLPEDTTVTIQNKKLGNALLTMSGKTYEITTFPFAGYADAPRMYLDSLKRNFSVNSLYYSIDEKKIYDYHSGITDIHRKTPKFVGKVKDKLKENPIYPMIYARLHSRMNGKDMEENQEIKQFTFPKDVNRQDIADELRKGIKQCANRTKYFTTLNELGLLSQIFPNLKVNPNANLGEMILFPQVLACILQPNWNNLGHLSQVLTHLKFTPREIHDIMFLMRLPHFMDENTFKSERLHTSLSERAVQQFVKTTRPHNSKWILEHLK